MSATGGFWPGESSAGEEEQAQASEPEVVEPRGWPEPDEQAAEPEKPKPEVTAAPVADVAPVPEPEPEPEAEVVEEEEAPEPEVAPAGHLPGELDIPDGVAVLEGSPSGAERTVGVVVSRFNGEISDRLLASALEALAVAGVAEERITVMPVPGAFELPIGAMALAKTRRYSCVIALGCVVRGETAHFDYVASEAASGLQLAGLETGVPVAFGVLTVDTVEQAEARVERGADAARAALEMADLFSQVRRQAKSG
jgi:6,7-dimethyl-8-ribityllumazine synthase